MELSMPRTSKKIFPPWSIPVAVIILAVIIAVFTFMDLTRQDRTVSRILSEKGGALIKALEAGARTGMRGRFGKGIRLQHLLEETARQPDILFICVTDSQGIIVAHSDRSKIGLPLYPARDMPRPAPGERIQWFLDSGKKSSPAFVVYRNFSPMTRHIMEHRPSRDNFCSPGLPCPKPEFMPGIDKHKIGDDSGQLIFLGLDRTPFTSARNKDRSTTVLVAGLLLLLGVAGFLALFWALGLKTSKRMLMDARALADDLKEQVRRTEKLAAVGSLAAGVAHEIRNPLSSIKGLATYFGSKFDTDSEEKKLARVMVEETDRLNRVITELLEFARPSMPNLENVHLKDLVAHSLRLVHQDAATGGITISSRISEQIPVLALDQDRVLQVLINLYLNAIQAMPRGGTLSVSAVRKGNNVLLHIADTGPGIPEQDLGKIFDPYFTTKNSGTGLGLATVHKIMESHAGTVEVSSLVGRGTTFTLTFPLKRSDSR